ncbi:LacI family DNA-binding transcriptional regulator [Atopobacter phocae]|uniref:LacI family DNA-binding transcriptional regulator n=1 Tax=Atopobacter phocae TaxID=136492 RepID=UPI000470E13C|nr:LacI family DNA-binding transcriptional regulator [Atopobacter phocae]
MAITIRDVAQKAGVAPSTVTRVIQDSPAISLKTKQRVRQVMSELNYIPNLNARSLASSKTSIIGLILPPDSDTFYQNPFFPTVLRGISKAASHIGYTISLISGNNELERRQNVEKTISGGRADGLLFLYAESDDPIMQLVNELNFPYVVIGNPSSSSVNFVDNDNIKMAYDATEYLLNRGNKKIGFIGGNTEMNFIKNRFKGYQDALKNNQLTMDEQLIFNELAFVPEIGYQLALTLNDTTSIDAMVIADQLVASGFRQAVVQHDLPIEIITFKAYNSSITISENEEAFIHIDAQRLGQVALEMMLKIIEDSSNRTAHTGYFHEIIHHELIELTQINYSDSK